MRDPSFWEALCWRGPQVSDGVNAQRAVNCVVVNVERRCYDAMNQVPSRPEVGGW